MKVSTTLGAEDHLKGQIDVLNQKAVIYSDNDQLGSTYEVVDIPADQKAVAAPDPGRVLPSLGVHSR
jgi:hypothetical protein